MVRVRGRQLLVSVSSGPSFSVLASSLCLKVPGLSFYFFACQPYSYVPDNRWLASHGRMREAQHALARSRGINSTEEETDRTLILEMDIMKSDIEREAHLSSGWIDCFRWENMTLYRTLLGKSLDLPL